MMPKHWCLGFLLSLSLTSGGGSQPAQESLKPQRVQFQSRNFRNVLRWQPGQTRDDNSSAYFVQYKMYGDREWKNKENCWGTRELFCDLTNETSDLQEPYYGRVRMASAGRYSGWSMTPRFIPWWEMKIDPPVINITRVNGSLLVVLQAPVSLRSDQRGKTISKENYGYRVFIIENSLKMEQQVYEGPHRVVEIETLIPRSGACIVAEIYIPRFNKGSPRSEKKCVGSP
ncbi:interleukin-22 receptor subunit alpha-2 [Ctenodactylus gundi]